ncbi:fatty acid-binding protein DegV-like protein [Mycoplasmopsis maculosa]|uniref:Fatty acid-binding protein DegV-like protein n=1 Tax=Mycoplasmopsis maculosa TaxID=114885 RepID=A0A449B3P9_9BACT|nr:DegV family protein [Mycoplasmopsis maculosa]VEU75195.1 fatty acid-binding protein DegV-like protein [Mycoplasmopsis maculosa]
MSKIGFIFDSFVCSSEKELNEQGFGYLPFRSDIDGITYEDGIDVDQNELLNLIAKGNSLKSSLPRYDRMTNLFEKMSAEYDYVIYLPISDSLSSTYKTALNLSKDYSNIVVYNNEWGGDQLIDVANYAKKVYEETKNLNKVIKVLDYIKERSLIYVLPTDLKYVINGGRVSAVKKFALKTLNFLKMHPIIKFYESSATTGGIAKSIKSGVSQIIDKLLKFATQYKYGDSPEKYNIHWLSGISNNVNETVKDVAKEMNISFKTIKPISSSVAIHTGPEAFSVSIMPNLDEIDIKL